MTLDLTANLLYASQPQSSGRTLQLVVQTAHRGEAAHAAGTAQMQQPLSVSPLAERLKALFAGKWVMILPNSLPLRRSREAWWPWLALQLIKHLIHD